MRRTKEDAEKTKQDILEAALAEFSEKGYAAARLEDIARRAGTTRGAIYHHFENKADLYKELVESAAQQGNVVIQTAISSGGSFEQICRLILTGTLQLLEADKRFRQITALSLFKTGDSEELAAIDEKRESDAQEIIQGISGYMQIGINNGEARADISPDVMARAFLAYQNGLAWLWLAAGENFLLQKDAEQYADLLLNGLLAKH